ncbi:unnamed protein product [Cyprideis torosa]|uniref:Uncharacterized protein n=1 Tax=Cyprideis torosa TaxID=163714 RepID=A0A7R8WG87_9CRUS|nr:unnamed protein product [Cyprideis torosa]CAG0891815.1 unnamed protein product [Cyprideis torosa]
MSYYKERLGFEPEPEPNGQPHDTILLGYEENLSKFKDERDHIQKKTFTKWVNKHLKKAARHVKDLFVDLRDGHNLIALLEVLSGIELPLQRGNLRFHMIQNVQVVLDFLRHLEIKIVNIRAEDIVDGNPKLTLGLIWTIILKFQISDVIGNDSLSAKAALLRWAQKCTERYPNVNVRDFTKSWRDGLAFNALIHRHRPDLIDWEDMARRNNRERLENAFYVVEKEYSVTRLLDAEDVDRPDPDEKSIITYVSSLYDALPEPVPSHPMKEYEAERRVHEYKEFARHLYIWMHDQIEILQTRSIPTNPGEIRAQLQETNRFRNEDIPPKLKDKHTCAHLWREIEKIVGDMTSLGIDEDIRIGSIEHTWNRLMNALDERERLLTDEIHRQDRLSRIAEKLTREIRRTETRLEEIEIRIEEDLRRFERLRLTDANKCCEEVQKELVQTEETIRYMYEDSKTLKDGRYPEAPTLHRQVEDCHDHWSRIRVNYDNLDEARRRLAQREATPTLEKMIETNEDFRFLNDCVIWVKKKLTEIENLDYGSDLPSVTDELDSQQKRNREIESFQSKVERCNAAKRKFEDHKLTLYTQLLMQLQKSYSDLVMAAKRRTTNLETLLDFIQSATTELIWLNEKEEAEISRDWASRNLDVKDVEQYYENLMSELERREIQFSAVQNRGESLVLQQHPASKVIEAYMAAMQTQWSWLLQLILCLENHLQHVTEHHRFFHDASECHEWIIEKEKILNTTYSISDFSLERGEALMREMQNLRAEITTYADVVQSVVDRAKVVIPLKQRKDRLSRPIKVTAICQYKQSSIQIQKLEECTLVDNSNRHKWEVTNSTGQRGEVPGVVFLIPPPNPEAIDTADRLQKLYDNLLSLWQTKQHRMRQNMIFATIQVVLGWSFDEYMSMSPEQREAIKRALNEDAEKLIQEGDPNDPNNRRLKEEIDRCNALFAEYEARARRGEEARRTFEEDISMLQATLDDAERTLKNRCQAHIPRSLDSLEILVTEQREFESSLQPLEDILRRLQETYRQLPSQTAGHERRLEKCLAKWENIWVLSQAYVDRLKNMDIVLNDFEEANRVMNEVELKLSASEPIPKDLDELQRCCADLASLQATIDSNQRIFDQLLKDSRVVRPAVEATRPSVSRHPDVDRLEEDAKRMAKNWGNLRVQIPNRLKQVEAAADMLRKYKKSVAGESWMTNIELAMSERYRLCDENVQRLLSLLDKLEERLASQEAITDSPDKIKNQISEVKQIHDDVVDKFRHVGPLLDQVDHIVKNGPEFLTSKQVSHIAKIGEELDSRYQNLSTHVDLIHRRLEGAFEELGKCRSEMVGFQSWLSKARVTLEDYEHSLSDLSKIKSHTKNFKEFVGDVMAHQADLRFITMASQKFFDESDQYLKHLNNFRNSIPRRKSRLEATHTSIKDDVVRSTETFRDLLARANKLQDMFGNVGDKQKQYIESIERCVNWLNDVEPRASALLQEAIPADPRGVQEHLDKVKAVNNDIIQNSRLFDAAQQSAQNLLDFASGYLSPKESKNIEVTVNDLTDRYNNIARAVGARSQELEVALLESQGVQDALDSLMNWMNQVEAQMRAVMKPASLNRERLTDQINEIRILQSDIDSHRSSIMSVTQAVNDLVRNASNVRIAKKVEGKLQDFQSRFSAADEKLSTRGKQLDTLLTEVQEYSTKAQSFDAWFDDIRGIITNPDEEEFQAQIPQLARDRDSRAPAFEQMISSGKSLVKKKDVCDVTPIKDEMMGMEIQWKELGDLFDEYLKLNKDRNAQKYNYESLRDQVNQWLSRMERSVDALGPVAIDPDAIRRQQEEVKPLVKEHGDYGPTIDRVNELGSQCDTFAGDRTGSARRRSSAITPFSKRASVSSMSSRKGSLMKMSTVGRLLSRDTSGSMEALSPVRQELNEINNRYAILGAKLAERSEDLDAIRDEIKKHFDSYKNLNAALDKLTRKMPAGGIPTSKDEADKVLRQVREVQLALYDQQPPLDALRTSAADLLRKHGNVPGARELNDDVSGLGRRWEDLLNHCKNKISLLDGVKDFQDSAENFMNWLGAKEKMMGVLGPIASDARVVNTQMQQVQVLRDEFNAQYPQLQNLNSLGEDILQSHEVSPGDANMVTDKLNNINQKWDQLLGQLDERQANLNAALGATKDFNALLDQLQGNLLKISDDFDNLGPAGRDPSGQLRALEKLENDLDRLRPSLAEATVLGENLCDILPDPSERNNVKNSLAGVGKSFSQLQKKLGNRRAELESSMRDEKEFAESCMELADWNRNMLSMFSERLQVSADPDKLRQQWEEFIPLYKEITSREHEVIMVLNKGKELSGRGAKDFQNNMDQMQRSWQKLKSEANDRHDRLQSCMEHLRKYQTAQSTFLPWLSQAEDKFDSFKAPSFFKQTLEQQIREAQLFKNDLLRHQQEYDNNKSLGETFLSVTDIHKEGIKDELKDMRSRWDRVNNALIERLHNLEEIAGKLGDYSDNARDVGLALQRIEDQRASQDLSGRDPKALDKLKNLAKELKALDKPLNTVTSAAEGLCRQADQHRSDASHIRDEVDDLHGRCDNLRRDLDKCCDDLERSSAAVGKVKEGLKKMGMDLTGLEEELDAMKPIARDLLTLGKQEDEINRFMNLLNGKMDDLDALSHKCDELARQGYGADAKQIKESLNDRAKQLNRIQDRAKGRQRDIASAVDRMGSFYNLYQAVMNDLNDVAHEVKQFRPIGGDVGTIRNQKDEYASFQRRIVDPLAKRVSESNKTGQGLIQSAANGVSTAGLEGDLEKMNDMWNNLKQKLLDRERKLDIGLLQSGKFQEALKGLEKWLADTEDMVANQKPPSADYKVAKAQMQEQKFLNKMLLDRQHSVNSVTDMGKEIAANADPNEKRQIDGHMKDLMLRYNALQNAAKARMNDLEQTMEVAKEFQDKMYPLVEFMERAERKIHEMETVPTDEDKIQRLIEEHEILHDDILGMKPRFDETAKVARALQSLVGDEDARNVAEKMDGANQRYATLVQNSDGLGKLLRDSKAELRHLVLSYEDLLNWLDDTEAKLNKFKILSVFPEKLIQQMEEISAITSDIGDHQRQVNEVVDSGNELMKHISNEEAIQLKDKLDSIQRKYNDIVTRAAEVHRHAQEALPLVQQFHLAHGKLNDWLVEAEESLSSLESAPMSTQERQIERLEQEIQSVRPLVEAVNLVGPQLCQISPGDGASAIESLVTRDNRRFDAVCEKVQRRAERIKMSKSRAVEVFNDVDELLEWFREAENRLQDAEPPSCDPDVIRVQYKEHRALSDDIASQKGRVREALAAAKKLIREASQREDTTILSEKAEDLKDTMEKVSKMSADRLSILEQALPLAEHFVDTHTELCNWLDETERACDALSAPGLRPDLLNRQQEQNNALMQSIHEHKPLLDKLNKTGSTLANLCSEADAQRIIDAMESDNQRYNALKVHLRERQQALEAALQETSLFADKLDGMLSALENTADQVNNAEPISAHPVKIQEQIAENGAILDDLDKRETAFEAVKRAAADVISKAKNPSDPAVKDIKNKLNRLNSLWSNIKNVASKRGRSLDDALALANQFWDELEQVMKNLKQLNDALENQEPPAVEPNAIKRQQADLDDIRKDIQQTKPEVERCRSTGKKLMSVCGEPDKPEVKKQIEDMDNAWDNITTAFAKREKNLIVAMEKAMAFHDTLQNFLAFLDRAEDKFSRMGALGSDIGAIKRQMSELKDFKNEVDPHMVDVEALNRQAQELTARTSPDQAVKIKGPVNEINRRWDDLLRGIVERQRELDNALLKLGQFQHALEELLTWINRTEKTVDGVKPVYGDPAVIEVELAKLKVLVNDIQAHQTSVDTLNDAGRQLIESDYGSKESTATQQRLNELNDRWKSLRDKAMGKQHELESALNDARAFNAEIQDLILWLNDIDSALSTTKPVGGLPETAREQLNRFMEVFDELDHAKPKVDSVLQQGQDYVKRSGEGQASNLQHNLRTLKQKWDSVMNRANDKKIKLEIALKEATEFHEQLQHFVDWLTEAEKTLTNLQPVSRVMENILKQIDSHKQFQKDVSSHREVMLNLDKKGTHLKYFSQKQDVILIKNLLISVQHRWERVVAKTSERTRSLDLGYKETKEFHETWTELSRWLDDAKKELESITSIVGNNPEKIKQQLVKHKEFQRKLGSKQPAYDTTMKMGRSLKEKAPKSDQPIIQDMMNELKSKWNDVCNSSVERQRSLEEALLFTGQYKDAITALLDWLKKAEKDLNVDGPVHGDLDTVMSLVEGHKAFEGELEKRGSQVASVEETSDELLKTATPEDATRIRNQMRELTDAWERVVQKSRTKAGKLSEALKRAEELHKAVHMLLEWLSDAEMKLRFAGPLPETEEETRQQLQEHRSFMRELEAKSSEKESTLILAQEIFNKCHPDAVTVIKHWINIIQRRWEEVTSWAQQRQQRLEDHLRQLEELGRLLEELMRYLNRCESSLVEKEKEELPEELPELEKLIREHQEFMEDMASRQPDVDRICKQKRHSVVSPKVDRRISKASRQTSHEPHQTPSRETSPDYESHRRSSHDVTPQRDYPKPWMYGARSSAEREMMEKFQHVGPRFSSPPPSRKGSRVPESQIKNPKVRELWDKWRHVWVMAWERQRRLQERYHYLLEVERMKNFSFEEWRKRFMKWLDHKKSRAMDLFRKMDKDNDGKVLKDPDFIDGIIKSKFPTSRLEMQMVADIIDKNKDGYIDHMEWMAALRPDWDKPVTEQDIIEDEVQRQVALCTCRNKYKVVHIGEGRYRFGESQKLRLVRILRSTVMVRVGGGWVSLEEFLVKNDPCRAKGRTNVELREQFILPEGGAQSMTPFHSKRSASIRSSESPLPTTGPITKIREKTVRSSPMGRSSISSFHGDPHEHHDSPLTHLHQKRPSSISRGGSLTRAGSRGTGSKPVSRTGSEASLDSFDGSTPHRRSTTASVRRTGSYAARSATPTRAGTSGSRKGSAPPARQSTTTTSSFSSRTPRFQ